MSSEPALVLVLGMHRSGTSLLGSLLGSLGVALPGELIAADRHNPEGYFERQDITGLQEQLLIDLDRWWPSAAGVEPLPDDWLVAAVANEAAARLQALLAAESARQPGPWAIKDPRSSLLLPLWLRVAAELGLPLRLVLSVREPGEVVRSLLLRDRQAAGMTAQRAQQLWWRHNRQALLDGASCPLLVVHYDRWFDPATAGNQLARLVAFCCPDRDGVGEAQFSAALTRIKPEHRRSLSAEPTPEPLPERLRWLNRKLLALSGPNASGQQLERLRSRLQPQAMASPEEGLSRLQRLRRRLKRRLSG